MDILEIENLATGYDEKRISEDLSYCFAKGSITSIIGPNGCGKTTLLKTIARILPMYSGKIYLQAKEINQYSTKEIAQRLSILSQSADSQIDLSVFDLVSFGRYPYQTGWRSLTKKDEEKIQWALELTGLIELARESVVNLSGGQRQRVWIAMALVQDTELLLLDEPTTYLDPAHQLEILNVLKEINQTQGKTIVMTIHDINLASRFSDRLIAMKEGRIIKTGEASEVITKDVLAELFDIEAQIVFEPQIKNHFC